MPCENLTRQLSELLINAAQKLQASPRGSEQPQLPFSEVGVRECALATCRCRYWEGATVTNAGCNACRDAIDGFQIGLFALRSPDAWGSHAGIRAVDRWVSAPAHKAIADRINRNVTNDLRFQKQRCPSPISDRSVRAAIARCVGQSRGYTCRRPLGECASAQGNR